MDTELYQSGLYIKSVFVQCGGTIVEITIADHSTVISFSDYYEGAAPALIINHTQWAIISYGQRWQLFVSSDKVHCWVYM